MKSSDVEGYDHTITNRTIGKPPLCPDHVNDFLQNLFAEGLAEYARGVMFGRLLPVLAQARQ
jgi:hypothetical protein